MSKWEVADQISLPSYAEMSAGEAVPESFVEISMTVTGGHLKEDQEIIIKLGKVRLDQPEQLKFQVLEQVEDTLYDDYGYTDPAFDSRPKKIQLTMDAAPVAELGGALYTICYPVGPYTQEIKK